MSTTIKDLFIKVTKFTMPGGHEHLMEKHFPKGWKKDFHGNYYYKIGESNTMFTSHLDTADIGQPKEVTHVIKGDKIETDGKTYLGADDKAGVTLMIYMIQKNVPGLYYFFLNEERGCVGSRALKAHLKAGHKEDDLFKNINKVIALDRRDDDSVITSQVGERCCSDEFADELAKRLNEAGGFKYKKDPTGSVTDSHHLADIYPEITNLSVGYDDQHSVRESQNIKFLSELAEALCKVDFETLPIKRDPTKVEYTYSNYRRGGRSYYSEWDSDDWWTKNAREDGPSSSGRVRSIGPSSVPAGTQFINDYLGNEIRYSDAVWCEYDKQWCLKNDAIWVDYVGFYTCPDFDPAKVIKKEEGGFSVITMDDIKPNVDVYNKDGVKFGTIIEVGDMVNIKAAGGGKFICPPDKFLTYGWKIKRGAGSNKLTSKELKEGMIINHFSFGEGKIIGIRPDRLIVKIEFKDPSKGVKDIRVDVGNMTF